MGIRLRVLVLSVAVALVCGCAAPMVAEAAFGVEPGGFSVSSSSDQAGAHADLTTSFAFAQNEAGGVGGILRNVNVVLPVGFAGYPTSVKTCTPPQLDLQKCPVDSQIGTIEIALRFFPNFTNTFTVPVFNMTPPPNETAVFGFAVAQAMSLLTSLCLSVPTTGCTRLSRT